MTNIEATQFVVMQDEVSYYVVKRCGGVMHRTITLKGGIRKARRLNRKLQRELEFTPPKVVWEP